jgi:hypothetical protein
MGIEFVRDEADKKISSGQWDPLQVKNKDPKYHYRWIRKEKLNMERKVGFLKYEIVDGSKEARPEGPNKLLPGGHNVDGTVEVGDLVLARIPQEVHEVYRQRNREKIKAVSTGVSASFKASVPGGYEEHRDTGMYPGDVERSDVMGEEEK